MGVSTKDLFKGLFNNKKQEEVVFNIVEIDYGEFDSKSIGSSFIYAVSKYGKQYVMNLID